MVKFENDDVIKFDNAVIMFSPCNEPKALARIGPREIMFHVKHKLSFQMKGIVLSAKEHEIWVKIESFR